MRGHRHHLTPGRRPARRPPPGGPSASVDDVLDAAAAAWSAHRIARGEAGSVGDTGRHDGRDVIRF
ncbi:DUF429 domain-containing protein [Nocardiopsis sp. CC223A]|uniref:DUF429 domain-containing protein n=1 Tax=Nocardiopsis sp. CC223A TaxID=3044051 RepID=UPI00278C75A1|nr:DUF429 domain-containing protein [Nocardiopsis sp. CC223A]